MREVERRPSATLADLRAWLLSEHGVSLSTGTMRRTVRKLGLTLKKSRSAPPNRRAPTSQPHGTHGEACNAG
ncbi:MAG: winged helix-turn-helix domain-containing protein [Proteobacteria bacterium]|nr:winged helix-turn-helix domain-containing protein [Pseudomonadota bacterium]